MQNLVSNLSDMIEAEPEHWEDVLEHFTETMKEAGSLRGHTKATVEAIKKSLDMVHDHASGASGLTLHPKILRPVLSRPLGSLFKHAILRKGQNPVVDDIFGDLVEPIGKIIKGLPGTIKYVTDKAADVANGATGFEKVIVEEVHKADKAADVAKGATGCGQGMVLLEVRKADKAANVIEGAIDFGLGIVHEVHNAIKTVGDVIDLGKTVHDEVKDLVHSIGEGAQSFAHTVSGWFHNIFG